LQWHPDRQADTSADARELADWHIREVNAAWEVLRSPSSRAKYDEQLRGVATSATAVRDRTGEYRPPSFADRLVDPRAESMDSAEVGSRPKGWRWAPMVVIGVVFALILIGTAYAAHKHDSGSTPVQVQTSHYEVGSCVAVLNGPAAVTVPCDSPHTGTIAATTDYPRPCPGGTDPVALVDEQVTLCLTP
jgi:hypothetical protein